jgi:hypothetical protein
MKYKPQRALTLGYISFDIGSHRWSELIKRIAVSLIFAFTLTGFDAVWTGVTFGSLLYWVTKGVSKNGLLSIPAGNGLLAFAEFFFNRKKYQEIFIPIVADMREEYFEAMAQNRIGKARWVRVRGTYSFFAAIGLDRAFAFVSFFIKAWKSVN